MLVSGALQDKQSNMEGEIMAIQITVDGELSLSIDESGQVLVPMDQGERARCREALQDALKLLAETVVTHSTFSMAIEKDEDWIQTSPHHSDCLATFCCSHPSEQPADSQAQSIQRGWFPKIVGGKEPHGSSPKPPQR